MASKEEIGLVAEAVRSVVVEVGRDGAVDWTPGEVARLVGIRVGRVVCAQNPGEVDRYLIASGIGRGSGDE